MNIAEKNANEVLNTQQAFTVWLRSYRRLVAGGLAQGAQFRDIEATLDEGPGWDIPERANTVSRYPVGEVRRELAKRFAHCFSNPRTVSAYDLTPGEIVVKCRPAWQQAVRLEELNAALAAFIPGYEDDVSRQIALKRENGGRWTNLLMEQRPMTEAEAVQKVLLPALGFDNPRDELEKEGLRCIVGPDGTRTYVRS